MIRLLFNLSLQTGDIHLKNISDTGWATDKCHDYKKVQLLYISYCLLSGVRGAMKFVVHDQ